MYIRVDSQYAQNVYNVIIRDMPVTFTVTNLFMVLPSWMVQTTGITELHELLEEMANQKIIKKFGKQRYGAL